jgi:tetratricopeptide (TPR) repeat protein
MENNLLIISLKTAASLKSFSLKNPSRLVIDVYEKNKLKELAEKKKPDTGKKEVLKKAKLKEEKKNNKKEKKEVKKTAGKSFSPKDKTNVNLTDEIQKKAVAETTHKKIEDDSFVPEQYKGLWGLLQAGNFYTVLKELPNFVPKELKSLAAYHYMYGDAYRTAQKNMDAIKHLRLAYLYAVDEALKERALFERAELYKKIGLVYEARANYLVFIDKYKSSKRLADAHLGPAETLSEMQLFSESVEHYKKAGNAPAILFSKANTLQKIGKVSEARRAYADALAVDPKYPSKSAETYFYIGENMRMLGELNEAKRHLRSLTYGPYRDNSRLSLGHIAMEEADMDEAITNYIVAAKSNDINVRIEGLFNISKAFKRSEKLQEAIESLETIRNNYINSGLYKDTLLELAKLYKETGKLKDSVSLLKELVYGKKPPKEAFTELESIILAASENTNAGSSEKIKFVTLWREVGQWLIDEERADFLIQVSGKLRNEGEFFLKLSTWLVENASRNVRTRAAVDLADYYIGIGKINDARKYMDIAKKTKIKSDALLRVEAKVLHSDSEYRQALGKLMDIKTFEAPDLDQVGIIITKLEKSEQRLEAVAFYETILNSNDWEADSYNRMADILYKNEEKNKALKYYRIALKKSPENEWAAYRVGNDSEEKESKKMFDRLKTADSLLGQLARTKIMEIDLLNKVKEVY